jgi:CO/xanthine dehydrogenase Mo-binding subunit
MAEPSHVPPDREASAINGTDALRLSFFPIVSLLDEKKRMNNTSTYANNVHVAVIEVDKETGKVKSLKCVIVDDCGVAINPMIVEGQDHGGLLRMGLLRHFLRNLITIQMDSFAIRHSWTV